MSSLEKHMSVSSEILRLLLSSDGRPFSLGQLKNALNERGCKCDNRSVDGAVRDLERSGQIRTTQLAKATAVYMPWHLPLVEERVSLDELAKKGQFPLYTIIAKMKDVGLLEEEILEVDSPVRSRNRTRDQMEDATKEIMWWAEDFSRFSELKPSMVKALNKEGLKFRILMRVDLFSLKNAIMIRDLQNEFSNLEVRPWESRLRGAIFDRKKVRLFVKLPKPTTARFDGETENKRSTEDFYFRAFNFDSRKMNLRRWVNWFCLFWEYTWRSAEIGPKFSTVVDTLSELSSTP